MNNKKQIKNQDYANASKLLSSLIGAEAKVEQQINNYIQHYGVTNIFSKLDAFGFAVDIVEKLNAVKVILNVAKDGEEHA